MKIKKLEIESKILKRKVYQIEIISSNGFLAENEANLISKYNPYYIQCQIDASDLGKIHALEEAGFRFAEFRFKKLLDNNSFHRINDLTFFPYILKFIVDESEFRKAKTLVKESKSDDRFSSDPKIPKKISQQRLQAYLKKSFENFPEEFICGLYNKNTNELLAIKTGKINNQQEVTFAHTALNQKIDVEKFTYMIDALLISHFMEKGLEFFYTITSGFNLMEMDLHISDLKYKITSATVIVRKIYS